MADLGPGPTRARQPPMRVRRNGDAADCPAGAVGGIGGEVSASGGQTAEPAFHWAQLMFQPLRPLSGETVLSPVFETTTTSPTIEWL